MENTNCVSNTCLKNNTDTENNLNIATTFRKHSVDFQRNIPYPLKDNKCSVHHQHGQQNIAASTVDGIQKCTNHYNDHIQNKQINIINKIPQLDLQINLKLVFEPIDKCETNFEDNHHKFENVIIENFNKINLPKSIGYQKMNRFLGHTIVTNNNNDKNLVPDPSANSSCDIIRKSNLAFCPNEIRTLECLQLSTPDYVKRLKEIENEIGIKFKSPLEINSVLTELDQILSTTNRQSLRRPLSSPIMNNVIHSTADYIHCLIPDLKTITNSSYYWGKIDRYEAEKLLEFKPDGTFLLRDSVQEEHLFSVTFRKYGRSLHARIEQFNHRFSFDSHDPELYTSPTINGLLEHYSNSIYMFEPMLTMPLRRNFPFSLQQLCRASIVNKITYDDIKELNLPNSIKRYLKTYHYKICVRIKPLENENDYANLKTYKY